MRLIADCITAAFILLMFGAFWAIGGPFAAGCFLLATMRETGYSLL